MKTRRRKKSSPVMEEPFTVVDLDDFEMVCRVCDAEFLDEDDLKMHVAQVHLNESNGKTICKFCCTVLPGAEQFVSHFIRKHLEHTLFCPYCYRAFEDPLIFDQHELKHCAVADDAAITCSQCSTILINRQELQKHEYQEHRTSKDGVMLNGFFSLLSCALNMKITKFLECLSKKTPFVCCKCKHSTSCVKDFIEHLQTSNCQCYACDTCFNVYKKKYSIVTHMRKKPQCHNCVIEKESKKLCAKCDKYFNAKDIKLHRASCEVLRCFTCKEQFKSIQELGDHRLREHQISISLEICRFCKKEFVGSLSLKRHMSRSHKDKSLYKYNCAYCGSLFTHPSKLFAHFFTQHKDIEPYSCKICDKYFRLRKQFTIHIKIQHKSIGFVEFGKNLHVIFTDKKSENPVEPQANMDIGSTTDASDSDCNDVNQEKTKINRNIKQLECREKEDNIELNNEHIDTTPDNMNTLKDGSDLMEPIGSIKIEIERINPLPKRRRRKQRIVRPSLTETIVDPDQLSDSEEEPLSNVRSSLLKKRTENMSNLKKRMAIRDKTAKLTCKICNKYCYTVQNYHHHLTLHEKSKMKRCIKCQKYFKSRKELKDHIESSHASSKLIETLKSVLEKRKKILPAKKPVKTGESLRSLLEKRKKEQILAAQNSVTNKFRRTIRKVNVVDDCTATITPMSDHGLSVKKFIETFRPETDGFTISNSVTIKAMTESVNKEPTIRMYRFNPEPIPDAYTRLSFPVKFKDPPIDHMDSKVNVKLVQKLITKPKLVNMTYNERIPVVQETNEPNEYCNMFADDTDYMRYRNDIIPEVAHEVMLGDPEDIPRTRRLAQEIIIPKIPEEHGGVRIGHLLPQAPYYKIVKVKKLLKAANEPDNDPAPEDTDRDVKLPDGTRLISVKNPFSHLIPNEHLKEILKANRSKYYTPKTKNIEKAIAKALCQVKPPREKRGRKIAKETS